MRSFLFTLLCVALVGCGGDSGGSATASLRPDLTIPAMISDPEFPAEATGFDILVEVRNTGVTSSPIAAVRLYQEVGGVWTALGDGAVPALSINQSAVLTFSMTGLASGGYAYRATVNPDGVVEETDVLNNSRELVIGVMPSGPG